MFSGGINVDFWYESEWLVFMNVACVSRLVAFYGMSVVSVTAEGDRPDNQALQWSYMCSNPENNTTAGCSGLKLLVRALL